MKILTWNCNGAFRKKYQEIERFQADLYVIQECENPEHTKGEYRNWAGSYLWYGDNKNKGIGIFAKNGVEIQRLDWKDNSLQLFLPVRVNNQFNMIGVWTKQANSPTFRYIGQLWKYLELHKEKMAAGSTVLCGDLNSNKIWDVWDRWWNHSDVVRELDAVNMQSLYHLATGEEQGSESAPTLYLQRNLKKAYHIDFAFASEGMFNPQKDTITVGSHNPWLEFSDHAPVIFTIAC
ncbi:endonuclease/exonuclease/phosphatase family protein [Pseudomonas cavernicola]|uniref:Endonuclease/exonuclease/phosphatase family protein n=1 Tax=Pseudomonas cavernicola TaxID=2320866 RepID=A0A418XJE7_9PSED|nr:endonuclease/exonuclease/phosphatase family protein [Pseudomonas cavernicola]RJG12603.1 endonuclease/exonuclease/phosphatase family protein [Pseudomonas cavernicola]